MSALHTIPFVGRERELEVLTRTLRPSRRRAPRGDRARRPARGRSVLPAAARVPRERVERGDYATTIDALMPMPTIANRLGGSHAQRDVIHLTLTEAALRARRRALARALTAERLELRPTNPFNVQLTRRAPHLGAR